MSAAPVEDYLCASCGHDVDGDEHGRDYLADCFIDPAPTAQWEVTTPAAVYATGPDHEEWLP